MKATGIVRRIDDLGRVVLPIEMRRMLGIDIKDPIEIFVEKESIVLKRYEPACIFCGGVAEKEYRGKSVCRECIGKL